MHTHWCVWWRHREVIKLSKTGEREVIWTVRTLRCKDGMYFCSVYLLISVWDRDWRHRHIVAVSEYEWEKTYDCSRHNLHYHPSCVVGRHTHVVILGLVQKSVLELQFQQVQNQQTTTNWGSVNLWEFMFHSFEVFNHLIVFHYMYTYSWSLHCPGNFSLTVSPLFHSSMTSPSMHTC